MNPLKRTVNPLLGRIYTYKQADNTSLKYQVNWGATIQPATVVTSTWTVDSGTAVLSSESFTDTGTSVVVTIDDDVANLITNKITMSDNQIDERSIKLTNQTVTRQNEYS